MSKLIDYWFRGARMARNAEGGILTVSNRRVTQPDEMHRKPERLSYSSPGPYKGYTALYGGSFNPPHLGHQMFCLTLLSLYAVDEVWLIPVAEHPFGKSLEPFSRRMQMCRLMSKLFGRRVRVSDIEHRIKTSLTYDVVQALKKKHPERRFCLALGSDIQPEVKKWYRFNELEQLLPMVLVGRQGVDSKDHRVVLPNISSTAIRQALKSGKEPHGLPQEVFDFIALHQLYT